MSTKNSKKGVITLLIISILAVNFIGFTNVADARSFKQAEILKERAIEKPNFKWQCLKKTLDMSKFKDPYIDKYNNYVLDLKKNWSVSFSSATNTTAFKESRVYLTSNDYSIANIFVTSSIPIGIIITQGAMLNFRVVEFLNVPFKNGEEYINYMSSFFGYSKKYINKFGVSAGLFEKGSILVDNDFDVPFAIYRPNDYSKGKRLFAAKIINNKLYEFDLTYADNIDGEALLKELLTPFYFNVCLN